MKFDVVIGNPPYNNDIYIDFVVLACQLASQFVCEITPAKWQAKRGNKNEKFRSEIVPYISNLVYYPDCGDIFNIRMHGGIAYYLIHKEKTSGVYIESKCNRVKSFESNNIEHRQLYTDTRCFLYNDMLYNICNKVGCFNKDFKQFNFEYTPENGNFNVFASAINADAGGKTSFNTFSKDGNLTMLAPFTISKDTFLRSTDTKCFYSSSKQDEAESFISWAQTKFIRFMLLMRFCTYHNNNTDSWRFVPDPGEFNHIFTDIELYKKYNLTQEEITIIESVIKKRK